MTITKCPRDGATVPVRVTAREVDASRNAPGRSGSGPETSARTAKSWRQAWALPTKRVRTRRGWARACSHTAGGSRLRRPCNGVPRGSDSMTQFSGSPPGTKSYESANDHSGSMA